MRGGEQWLIAPLCSALLSMSAAAGARSAQQPAAAVRTPTRDDFIDYEERKDATGRIRRTEWLAVLDPVAGDSADVRTVLLARTKAIDARAAGAKTNVKKRAASYADPILRITEDFSRSFANRAAALQQLATRQQIEGREKAAERKRVGAAIAKKKQKRVVAKGKNKQAKEGTRQRSPHVSAAPPSPPPRSAERIQLHLQPTGRI